MHAAPQTPNTSCVASAADAGSPWCRLKAPPQRSTPSPALSMVSGSCMYTMREVTSAKRFGSSRPAASARSHPASAAVSLFRNATSRPRASRAPMLLPAAKPRFSPSVTSLTHGKRDRTYSGVSSVDALSTTIVSVRTPRCAATLCRHVCRCWRPFHVTITIEMSGSTHDLAVNLKRTAGRTLPGEGRRPGKAARP